MMLYWFKRYSTLAAHCHVTSSRLYVSCILMKHFCKCTTNKYGVMTLVFKKNEIPLEKKNKIIT